MKAIRCLMTASLCLFTAQFVQAKSPGKNKTKTASPAEASAPASETTGTGCKVDSIAFARGIEGKLPEGVAKSFAPGLIYCWSRVKCGEAPGTLKHVWYQGSVKMREIPMSLNSASGRIWSQKQVTPGTWRVDIVSESGDVAGSGTVQVE